MDEVRAIELYESPDGAVRLDVCSDGETVWLTEAQMAELFGTTRQSVNLDLQRIYVEQETERGATRKDFLQVRQEGARSVRRPVAHDNLDAVLCGLRNPYPENEFIVVPIASTSVGVCGRT